MAWVLVMVFLAVLDFTSGKSVGEIAHYAWALPAIMGVGLLMDLIGGITGNQQQKAATEKENQREDQYNSQNANLGLQLMNMLGQPIGVPGQPGLNDPSAFQQAPAPDGALTGMNAPAMAPGAAAAAAGMGAGPTGGLPPEAMAAIEAMLGGAMGGGQPAVAPVDPNTDPNMMGLAQMMGGTGGAMGAPQDGYAAGLMGLLTLLGGLSGQGQK